MIRKKSEADRGLTVVTGATGHLGGALLRQLLNDGHRVRVVLFSRSEKEAKIGSAPQNFAAIAGLYEEYGSAFERVQGRCSRLTQLRESVCRRRPRHPHGCRYFHHRRFGRPS
ncbi:MAG: KR domain-containing protein [Deltaproteobacteria bacterium]|nr:KR domain-containing protein [Deltaproteobacteria bacterium]